MSDLKDQIRTYYEATTEPVDVHDVVVESGTVLVGPFPDAAQRRAMDTKSDERKGTGRRGWRGPMAAAVAFVAILVVGTGIVLATRGGTSPSAPASEATTTPTTSTETAEAADAGNPTLVFDGESCTFQTTPDLVVGSSPRFTIKNETPTDVRMWIWQRPATASADELSTTEYWASSSYASLGGTISVAPGDQGGVTVWLLEPGRYFADCYDTNPDVRPLHFAFFDVREE